MTPPGLVPFGSGAPATFDAREPVGLLACGGRFPIAFAEKARDCGIPVVVFNVARNKYRLVARVYYEYQRVYVKAVMTHGDYDAAKWKEQICHGQI